MKIDLTPSEINHLLALISTNERDGWYLAPREQWDARSKRLRERLENLNPKPRKVALPKPF